MGDIKQLAVLNNIIMGCGSRSVVSVLNDTIDYSLPGFSVLGILQARIPEWATLPFCRGSPQLRDGTKYQYREESENPNLFGLGASSPGDS